MGWVAVDCRLSWYWMSFLGDKHVVSAKSISLPLRYEIATGIGTGPFRQELHRPLALKGRAGYGI